MTNKCAETELVNLIAISQVPYIGPIRGRELIRKAGSTSNIFHLSRQTLIKEFKLPESSAESILNKHCLSRAEEEVKYCKKNGITIIPYYSKLYPKRFGYLPDAPLVLYYQGSADLNDARTIGIVGTRTPSEWGKRICEHLIEQMIPYEATTISGLAHGVDIQAHLSSICKGIPTIAVLGHGLGRMYPSIHRKYAEEIKENGGLLSSYLHDTLPDRTNFPKRNKLIAGLADVLIVVETKAQGGSMITADFACQYNRPVFAVPGRLGDVQSAGCIHLIKAGKARIFDHVNDIASLMEWRRTNANTLEDYQLRIDPILSDEELKVVEVFAKADYISIDQISYQTGIQVSRLSGILLALEFKKAIRGGAGKKYSLMPGFQMLTAAEPQLKYHT